MGGPLFECRAKALDVRWGRALDSEPRFNSVERRFTLLKFGRNASRPRRRQLNQVVDLSFESFTFGIELDALVYVAMIHERQKLLDVACVEHFMGRGTRTEWPSWVLFLEHAGAPEGRPEGETPFRSTETTLRLADLVDADCLSKPLMVTAKQT